MRSNRSRPAFRLQALPVLLAALLTCGHPSGLPTAGAEEKEVADFPEVTRETQQAVERGLDYLAAHQAADGSFGEEYTVAITSMACLSFMANGNLPGRGKHGEAVRKGLRYILDCARLNARGYITEPGGSKSRMHGHGYATLFLAEAVGMSEGSRSISATEVREALKRAVNVIVSSQTTGTGSRKDIGGWGYEPNRDIPDEASVTITAIQALRAARDAGIYVDAEFVIDRAINYVKACFDEDTGSFRYSIAMNNRHSSFALTAAAISVLNYAGAYDALEIREGLKFMMERMRKMDRGRSGHYFYEVFYASLATYNAGGVYWRTWCPLIQQELIAEQRGDGSWQSEYCAEYCTAFATLLLQIPNRYLPIFQK